jgi:hypothetical protein
MVVESSQFFWFATLYMPCPQAGDVIKLLKDYALWLAAKREKEMEAKKRAAAK